MKTTLLITLGAVGLAGLLLIVVALAVLYQLGRALYTELKDVLTVVVTFSATWLIVIGALFSWPFMIIRCLWIDYIEWLDRVAPDRPGQYQSYMWIDNEGGVR